MAAGDHDLPFKIEAWDDADQHVEELIALVGDLATAQHTYNEAVKRRPEKLITLRQKARVIKQSR
jgi:hypothetical protein